MFRSRAHTEFGLKRKNIMRKVFPIAALVVWLLPAGCPADKTGNAAGKGKATEDETAAAPAPLEREQKTDERVEPKPAVKPDAGQGTRSANGGAGVMFEGFSPEARVDRLSRAKALRLCNLDRAMREDKADRNQAAGLGCKLAAATFARSREGCRKFYADCRARSLARPKSEDICQKLDRRACRITVAEFVACRRAEERVIRELLQKLDCEYQGPRLTAAPPTPECDIPKKRCPQLFDYPNRLRRQSRSGGKKEKPRKAGQ